MTDQTDIEWPTCDEDGCIGVRLAAALKCLAHACDEQRNATLKQLGKTGEIDARGVPISQVLFEQIVAAAPHDADNHPRFIATRFDRVTFQGDAEFGGAIFHGDAGFDEASFQGHAGFDEATFHRDAEFNGATFQNIAGFGGATFHRDAEFNGATFQNIVWCDGVIFQGDAGFNRATFQNIVWCDGVIFQGDARFGEATFQNIAGFNGATFHRPAEFGKATFHRDAGFSEATFHSNAQFDEATFQGFAQFDGATLKGLAGFSGANFRDAGFGRATFHRETEFGKATFHGEAGFDEATFHREAGFDEASFQGHAGFDEATFQGDSRFVQVIFQNAASFGGATIRGTANFGEARFEQARQLGPVLVYGVLQLDAASFMQLVQIEASTRGLSCQRARFPAGVQLRLRGAQIVLDDADLPSPSILVGITALSDVRLAKREQRVVQAVRRLAPQAAVELSARPRLLSVQGANVAGLTVSSVDLTECRFAGAHNLDRLRLESKVTFSAAPVRLPWDWRQVIAEERAWRAARRKRWATTQWCPAWLGREWPEVMGAEQIAGLYRALRKGREDAKDEPGAGDFYYGEMEMRRHARRTGDSAGNPTGEASRGLVERVILTVYWLISGYGLRAWRALAWLAVVTAGFAVAFHLAGFTRPPQPISYWTSLLYAFRATLSLTDAEVQLTAWGKLLQALLRLTGPVLLGLTLLAIRARTKR